MFLEILVWLFETISVGYFSDVFKKINYIKLHVIIVSLTSGPENSSHDSQHNEGTKCQALIEEELPFLTVFSTQKFLLSYLFCFSTSCLEGYKKCQKCACGMITDRRMGD